MVGHDPLQFSQFPGRKTSRAGQRHGIEPVFRQRRVPLHVNVGRLVTLVAIKEEPVWADPRNSWHASFRLTGVQVPSREKEYDIPMRIATLLLLATLARAEDLPLVTIVDFQPLAAQVTRVLTALDLMGEPLPEAAAVRKLIDAGSGDVKALQAMLDRSCLAGININPEQRVKVQQGTPKAELFEQGWRAFLVKVHNEAGITAVLAVDSPNIGQLANSHAGAVRHKWMDLAFFNKQPLRAHLLQAIDALRALGRVDEAPQVLWQSKIERGAQAFWQPETARVLTQRGEILLALGSYTAARQEFAEPRELPMLKLTPGTPSGSGISTVSIR